MKHILSLLFSICFFISAQSQNASRSILPTDVYLWQQIQNPKISPDGKWVLYNLSKADSVKDAFYSRLYMVSIDGKETISLTEQTKNPGAALPLIALQYHEVKINIYWNEPQFIAGNFETGLNTLPLASNAALYIDYVYLDTEERRRMAQASHEYLIEQTQYNEEKSLVASNNRIDLTFNHPVKELVWVCQQSTDRQLGNYVEAVIANGRDNFCNSSANGTNPVTSALLQLNGHDRFAKRDGSYFNLVQPNAHHTCIPDSPGINVYSFALKPEDHQPSGTCNFSRIDNAKLNLTFIAGLNGGDVKVFATNYNVLRIMSGMGGLAYSN
jgi:hypothetical protein